jgi:hypothetical protein
MGRAIAQTVGRRFPTAAARVRSQVRSCGICGGQSGIGAGFLRGQTVAYVPSGLSLTPPQETIKLN